VIFDGYFGQPLRAIRDENNRGDDESKGSEKSVPIKFFFPVIPFYGVTMNVTKCVVAFR